MRHATPHPANAFVRHAPRILANRRSGTHIAYASSWTLLWRFVTAPIARRDLFSADVPDTSVT